MLIFHPAGPSVVQKPQSIEVVVTQIIELVCSYKAKPEAIISWLYNGKTSLPVAMNVTSMSSRDGVYTRTTSVLSWRQGSSTSQRQTAGGTYTCSADNDVGDRQTTTAVMTVVCK